MQLGGDGGQRGAERVFERVDAGVVAIAPGEDGCPAGHRDGVGAITVVEYHSLGGKPADMTVVGVRGEVPAVDAPRLRGVVVAQDKQDIGVLPVQECSGPPDGALAIRQYRPGQEGFL